jgi:hypothetical protein
MGIANIGVSKSHKAIANVSGKIADWGFWRLFREFTVR